MVEDKTSHQCGVAVDYCVLGAAFIAIIRVDKRNRGSKRLTFRHSSTNNGDDRVLPVLQDKSLLKTMNARSKQRQHTCVMKDETAEQASSDALAS